MPAFASHAVCFMLNKQVQKDKFTKLGFSDWKHATGKSGILSVHDRCASHQQAMESWSQYKLDTQPGSSISDRMESSHSEVIDNFAAQSRRITLI